MAKDKSRIPLIIPGSRVAYCPDGIGSSVPATVERLYGCDSDIIHQLSADAIGKGVTADLRLLEDGTTKERVPFRYQDDRPYWVKSYITSIRVR